jgi:hypothetical protein
MADTDITQLMSESAPTFANVLKSIGNGVAASQTALDKSVIEAVKELNKTKITVATDVVLNLNEDGLPVVTENDLVTQKVSLLNYVSPTVHEWKHVALSMDLSMAAMNEQSGLVFEQRQSSSGWTSTGLFWGFIGWSTRDDRNSSSTYSAQTTREVEWQRGQVRMDAMLGPRRTTKFPAPAQVTSGPRMFVSPGTAREEETDTGYRRTIELLVKIVKTDGTDNINMGPIEVTAGMLQCSQPLAPGESAGETNTKGEAKYVLTRIVPEGFAAMYRHRVTVKWHDIVRTLDVVL